MKHVSIAQYSYICMLYIHISHHHSCLWVYQLTFPAPQRSLWHLQLNAISDADKRTTDGKCSAQRKCRLISHFHPFRFLMLLLAASAAAAAASSQENWQRARHRKRRKCKIAFATARAVCSLSLWLKAAFIMPRPWGGKITIIIIKQ